MSSFEGNLARRHEFCWRETRDYVIIRWKPGVSISPGIDWIPGSDTRTDGRTDRITIANTRVALRAIARKNATRTSYPQKRTKSCSHQFSAENITVIYKTVIVDLFAWSCGVCEGVSTFVQGGQPFSSPLANTTLLAVEEKTQNSCGLF